MKTQEFFKNWKKKSFSIWLNWDFEKKEPISTIVQSFSLNHIDFDSIFNSESETVSISMKSLELKKKHEKKIFITVGHWSIGILKKKFYFLQISIFFNKRYRFWLVSSYQNRICIYLRKNLKKKQNFSKEKILHMPPLRFWKKFLEFLQISIFSIKRHRFWHVSLSWIRNYYDLSKKIKIKKNVSEKKIFAMLTVKCIEILNKWTRFCSNLINFRWKTQRLIRLFMLNQELSRTPWKVENLKKNQRIKDFEHGWIEISRKKNL